MQASTSLMVPKEHLSRIQGLNQMLHGAMNIGAAPLGALLLSVLPMQSVLAIDIGTAILAVFPMLFIKIPQPRRESINDSSVGSVTVWQDLRAGIRYVGAWPGLLMIMVMATLINFLLTPASSLQPILVTEHFQGGVFELAWLESAWGVGVVVGGILLGVWGGFRRRVLTSLVGLIALGLGMAIIGLLPESAFGLAVGFFFIVGATNPIINGPLMAVVQAVVAPEMQGRVFTLMVSVATAMTPIGLMFAGPIADKFGVQTWFIVGGIVTFLLGLLGYFVPAVLDIEEGNGNNHRLDQESTVVPDLAPISSMNTDVNSGES